MYSTSRGQEGGGGGLGLSTQGSWRSISPSTLKGQPLPAWTVLHNELDIEQGERETLTECPRNSHQEKWSLGIHSAVGLRNWVSSTTFKGWIKDQRVFFVFFFFVKDYFCYHELYSPPEKYIILALFPLFLWRMQKEGYNKHILLNKGTLV